MLFDVYEVNQQHFFDLNHYLLLNLLCDITRKSPHANNSIRKYILLTFKGYSLKIYFIHERMILLKKNVLISILLISACLLTGCHGSAEPKESAATPEVVQESTVPTDEPTVIKYIGNKKSKVFHRTTCWWVPEEQNQVDFSSREEAVRGNYSPCGNCQP